MKFFLMLLPVFADEYKRMLTCVANIIYIFSADYAKLYVPYREAVELLSQLIVRTARKLALLGKNDFEAVSLPANVLFLAGRL